MKTVTVHLLPKLLQPEDLEGSVAIVIDVLRATSVMVTALAAGAERILACETIDAAKAVCQQVGGQALLCGERGGVPIEGFDCGNSPAEYGKEVVGGKTIVMTTTNGTRALAAAKTADSVVTASLLNLSAVVERVAQHQRVAVICAGTNGAVSNEDVLAAGGIAQRLCDEKNFAPEGDSVRLAMQLWGTVADRGVTEAKLEAALRDTQGGRNLLKLGYEADLARVARIDLYSLVPERRGSDPIELRI